MNLAEYKSSVLGKSIDLDKFPPKQPYQCVDLVSDYAIRVCGGARFSGNAVDIANQTQNGKFTWEANRLGDLNQFPRPGAIVVFGTSWGGGYGHTGVVVDANGNNFRLLQQNGPEPYVAIHTYGYNGVLGWLTPVAVAQPAAPPPPPAARYYDVRAGDNLTKIAKATGVPDWHQIYNLNAALIGPNPSMIRPGQHLRLP